MRCFLENSNLKAAVDSFGAELMFVMNKENNREYMWYGTTESTGDGPLRFVPLCRQPEE